MVCEDHASTKVSADVHKPWLDLICYLKNFVLVDIGEASSIALALEIPQATLVIDERKGRKIAKELNLKIIGTLKVLLKAKENGVISSVQEIID